MKLYNPDAGEVAEIQKLEPRGNVLVVHGRVFGAMPLVAELRPEQARAALKLLNLKTILFLMTILFRRSTENT